MLKKVPKGAETEDTDEAVGPFLDTRVSPHIRIISGVLDEDPTSPSGIILQGRIDPSTLRFLQVDPDYQRPLGNRPDIYEALKAGTVVPNIEVGVRGQDIDSDGPDIIIKSPAYIVDGWQRIGTARQIMEQNPNFWPRIFGSFHFGTDAIWERHRFTDLNKNVKKVSPNLHLRNMRDSNEAVLTLYGLSNNTKDFPLYKRVSWSQNRLRGELISARDMASATRRLHAHVTTVRSNSTSGMAEDIYRAAGRIGLHIFRRNITTYFNVIDECWGIRNIEYRHSAPQIKSTFMGELARLFSLHTDFWDDAGKVLFVSADMRRKLAKFPVQDPHVKHLASSAGSARLLLYDMLVSHVNSGRRTGRLQPRYAKPTA